MGSSMRTDQCKPWKAVIRSQVTGSLSLTGKAQIESTTHRAQPQLLREFRE